MRSRRSPMKIKVIRAVNLHLPPVKPRTSPRRPASKSYAPRALPMSKYPEWPPGLPGDSPGIGGKTVWVQVVAEDGTWGYPFTRTAREGVLGA
ncbi:MAG: hypothetical protein HY332_19465 [Chloroflexi bacterium]|nr:hypothetical protein [Chloroflexota bacterium]